MLFRTKEQPKPPLEVCYKGEGRHEKKMHLLAPHSPCFQGGVVSKF